jgi:hypothetical protein
LKGIPVSEKKQGNKAAKPRKVYQAKPHPSIKVKRNADGTKTMKVARGTARAKRREGLEQGWKERKTSLKAVLAIKATATASAQAAA